MGTSTFPGGTTETWNDLSVLTTRGDVLYGSSGSPKGTRLGIGGASTHINSDGTDVAWAANETFASLSPLTTRGDILLATSGTTTGTRLAVGGATEVLTSDGTDAAWSAAGGGSLKGCRVYNSATQTVSSTVVTELTWDSETFDTDAFHSTASATGRITIPAGEGGKYIIYANLQPQVRSSGLVNVITRVNGSDAAWSKWDNPNDGFFAGVWDILDLSAADYVQCFVYQDSGSTVDFYFHSTAGGGMNSPCNFGCLKVI